MTPKPLEPRAGEPILVEQWQWLFEQIEASEISVVPPLFMPDENTIAVALPVQFWAQITGAPTGAKHPWKEIQPLPAGTWQDGPRSGTVTDDPAYETNGSTANLTGKKVWMRRNETNFEMSFMYGSCS